MRDTASATAGEFVFPDVNKILAGLKPFQQKSVGYVFSRLYGPDHTRRFLLADEVGLGKTLVAKGLIARAIEHLRDRVHRIDVVYICSNHDIARQNINRLNVTGTDDFALASRITLLPIHMGSRQLRDQRLNFVSFTPGTSFDLKSSLGVSTERALLYHLLREVWQLKGVAPIYVLRGYAGVDPFRRQIDCFRNWYDIDPHMADQFAANVTKEPRLHDEFIDLCGHFHRADVRVSDDVVQRRNGLIGNLRALLARTCLQSLQPDVIILDEFQRFKHLLSDEHSSEASQLAHDLFRYSDEHSEARVLLLSATPYKMYTVSHESAEDDHYTDFLDTVRFLLKEDLRERCEDQEVYEAVRAAAQASGMLLPWEAVRSYFAVDPQNPRLRDLQRATVDAGAWRILWVPPSLPYYSLRSPFAELAATQFTKRLVFSNWQVVPKVVATLLSYEAERQMVTGLDKGAQNTPEGRKAIRPLLNFTRSKERLTGMPVLGLLYPSFFLAERFDPLRPLHEQPVGGRRELDDVLRQAEVVAAEALVSLTEGAPQAGAEDESWYWAAPLLLDQRQNPTAAEAWFADESLPAQWSGTDESEGEDEDESLGEDHEDAGWRLHVQHARQVLQRGRRSLGRPPDDLARVVALLAVAGPAVVALRALARVSGGTAVLHDPGRRHLAGRIAWAFRGLFNSPDVISLIRGLDKDEPYWRRVVEYCAGGCLQAVMDEYAHVLRESLGDAGADEAKVARDVAQAMSAALSLHVARPGVDQVSLDEPAKVIRIENQRLRARFAMRFGDERSDDGQVVSRKDQVRQAFNSPFWPFVLVTTSIGQEGLDFHTYCHAVVHWNLPSNPVDMEQREGRVHRYKVAYLLEHLSPTEAASQLERLRIDLSPPAVDIVSRGNWLGGSVTQPTAESCGPGAIVSPCVTALPPGIEESGKREAVAVDAQPSSSPPPSSGGQEDEGPPPIDETDRNDVLATVREVFSSVGPRDRDQAIREVAAAMGYRRTGSRIRDVLSRDIPTAVRRGILDNTGGQLSLLCRTIDHYTLDHLVDILLAAMGATWWSRDAAITAAARHLGFRRTGPNIQSAFKSAINAAIRRSLLERDGADHIRKAQ